MECLKPINIRSTEKYFNLTGRTYMQVPCGKCEACIESKRNMWYIRLLCEKRDSISCYFVTLTYRDECLPINSLGYPTFDKRDVQLFLKRLRKYISTHSKENYPLRYFLVSEYGSDFLRPHYHLLLFNFPPELDCYKTILNTWGKGFVSSTKMTNSRIGYCSNYMYGKSDMPPKFMCDESNKLFMLSSRKPGIGFSYLNDAVIQYHRDTLTNYIVDDKNVKFAIPRYLSDKIFTDEQKVLLFLENRERIKAHELELIAEHLAYINEFGPDAAYFSPVEQRKLDFKRKFYNKVKSHRKNQLTKKIK